MLLINTIEPSQRTAGYLFQCAGDGTEMRPPVESWHRTHKGALKALRLNGGYGYIYRLRGDLSFKVN